MLCDYFQNIAQNWSIRYQGFGTVRGKLANSILVFFNFTWNGKKVPFRYLTAGLLFTFPLSRCTLLKIYGLLQTISFDMQPILKRYLAIKIALA